jgi:hypothetical protein
VWEEGVAGAILTGPYGKGQARTGRGIHGRTKVSCGPAKPDPYTPCGWATPQTALRLFGGWPARRAGGLRPSSSTLDTPSRTGLALKVVTGPYGKEYPRTA